MEIVGQSCRRRNSRGRAQAWTQAADAGTGPVSHHIAAWCYARTIMGRSLDPGVAHGQEHIFKDTSATQSLNLGQVVSGTEFL